MSQESTLKELLQELWDGLTLKPGRSIIAPGVETAWDDCCDGQLAVSLTSSQIVYNRDVCPIAVDHVLTVELVRCVATVDDDGDAPTQEEISADGLRLLRDMREMACVLSEHDPKDQNVFSFHLNQYTPVGLEGGCGGGKWTVDMRTSLSWLA